MNQHVCTKNYFPKNSCMYCIADALYLLVKKLEAEISLIKEIKNHKNKEKSQMDKKINKVLSKEKGAIKETKELLKMDKKQDKKIDKMKKKGC